MDAQARLGQPLPHGVHDGRDFLREAAAVGVAQDQELRAGFPGGAQACQGVLRVGLESVEEVLGVVEKLLGVGPQEGERIADEFQVAFEGDLQGVGDVDVPGLAEDGQDRRARLHQSQQVLVVFGHDLGGVRGAEGCQLGRAQLVLAHLGEEALVLGVGTGPSAFDVGDAELVEPGGDAQLVLGGQVQLLGLRAVAQGGVVDLDGVHGSPGIIPGFARPVRAACRATG